MVRDAVHDDHLADGLGRDAHPADRVDGIGGRDGARAPRVPGGRVPPGDELGENGDGDLLLPQRAKVEPGGAADAGESRVVDPAVAQDIEDRRRPAGARDEPDIAGARR